MTFVTQAPRRLQLGIVGLYVAIVALGSLISESSYFGSEGANYLASRGNLLNKLFVKRGWFWFSVIFWTSYFGRNWNPNAPATQSAISRPHLRQVLARYTAATLWWFLFTQWLLGAPLMDRVFTLTGGECVVGENAPRHPVTSVLCRKLGGEWLGGHDPSGHVFILVHSSIVLWMEILPELCYASPVNWAVRVPLALLALWAFMLFNTVIYFHSQAEKFSGLFFGLVEAVLVYICGETASWGSLFGVRRTELPLTDSTPADAETVEI